MAREILFRGKRTGNGEWVTGTPFFFADRCKMIQAVAVHPDFVDEGNVYYSEGFPVDLETVGQFVGRCDSNGTKIFDGDIVIIMDGTGCANPIVGVIQFENCGFFFKFGKYGKVLFGGWVTECYVIGNTHDNPELLNGTES